MVIKETHSNDDNDTIERCIFMTTQGHENIINNIYCIITFL